MENGHVTGAATDGLRIDETAPVISRHSVTVQRRVGQLAFELDAASTQHPPAVERLNRGLDESRLADARLADDQHRASVAARRVRRERAELTQLRLPRDQTHTRPIPMSSSSQP
jgi:hypothetical protein